MTKNTVIGLLLASLAAVMLTGCQSFDGEKIRRDHADSYQEELAQKTAEALKSGQALTLDDCIRIALENSLEVRSAQIQQRIAKLERRTAFANFLPTVDLGYQYTNFDPQIVMKIGGFETPRSDKRVREVTWNIQMSVFNPATWFLYSMHSRGAEIAELVTEYTKQMTVLQVTASYFYCLSLGEYERVLDSQLKAAEALKTELEAFHAEGLASAWQAGQARILMLSHRIERDQTHRAYIQAEADLLTTMGLSPLAEVSLEAETFLRPVTGSLEDLVSEALLGHPQLRISDRTVAIEREAVKTAFANFLPVLMGFASHTDTSDSFLKYSNYWAGGLAGTLSVFNGFANINEYKAARERREESFLEREQASLAVMLAVIKAHLNLDTAAQEMQLAEENLKVVSAELVELQQKWQEGLVDSSELLDVTAQGDRARMQTINARFQYQVSAATLLNVMGKTKIDYEEPEHDGAS